MGSSRPGSTRYVDSNATTAPAWSCEATPHAEPAALNERPSRLVQPTATLRQCNRAAEAAFVTIGGLAAGAVGAWLLSQMLSFRSTTRRALAVPWSYLGTVVLVAIIREL